jgi:hypothetical protein
VEYLLKVVRTAPAKKYGPIAGAILKRQSLVGNVRKGDASYRSTSRNGTSGTILKIKRVKVIVGCGLFVTSR